MGPDLLRDKIAFVTGSTRGIGWATAQLFAENGAAVILNGRSDAAALTARVEEIRSRFGVPCTGILADAANPAAIRAAYPEIFKQFKRLDILVNNAGVMLDGMIGMITEPLVKATLDVNIAGPIYHLQEASRLMARKGGGSIINLSSIIGRVGNEGQAVYASSKAALLGLTFAAAKELAPKNIRVNAVAPGYIETDLTSQLPPGKAAEVVSRIRMARPGQPADVARVILFLASDLSAYVTGQVIGVDGGLLI